MRAPLPKPALALLGACALLAAAPASAQAPPAGSAAAEAGAGASQTPQPPPGPPAGGEGAGGRTALSRWTLALDPADRGLARGWQRGGFSGAGVGVPGVVDPTHITGRAGLRNYAGSIAWYRTSFTAPQAATYALAFASANFQADVWVDGRHLASHRGSYLPFEARAALGAGAHTAVVRVDWRDPERQSRLGFHRTWFNWGGLNGPVSVRALGESELSAPTLQTTLAPGRPDAESATLRIGVRVRNLGPSRSLAPTGTLARAGQSVPIAFPAQTLARGQSATMSTTVTLERPALWAPGSPNLYDLTLAVGQESSYSARVGLRQLSWSGGRVFLNGQRLQLHGASLQQDVRGHGDALTPADEDTLVAQLKAAHANAARSQHPLDPGLLERLDAAGILLWQGIGPVEGAGNWYSNSPALLRGAEAQARDAAQAAQLHPSILAWNLVDEVAGNGRNAAEVAYVQHLVSWLHAHDPSRMVAVDVWGDHPPTRAAGLYRGVDAVAETDYTGWYDSPLATPAQQTALMRSRLAAMERTFPGRVLLISEFGAESNTLNPPGAPGSYSYQSALLARHIAVYAADPKLTGMLIWDLRDYPLNPAFQGGSIHFKLPHVRLIEGFIQKGLFTYAGGAKPALAEVARLYGGLG